MNAALEAAAEAPVHNAKGTCARCHAPGLFPRRGDQRLYLEVHHKKRLADGGEDTVANAIAMCSNCHREMHYGV